MKKILCFCVLVVLTIIMLGCSNKTVKENIDLIITGDIDSYYATINVENLDTTDFTYIENEQQINAKGYRLDLILQSVSLLSENNWIFITGTDNTSIKIDFDNADLCNIVVENEKLNIIAPELPRATGIKDISEITIVSKDNIDYGLKIVNTDGFSFLSYGNAKLALFEQISENRLYSNTAYKYMLKAETKISDLTNNEKNILYFKNFDILKADNSNNVFWKDGKLCCQTENLNYCDIIGIVTDTDTLTYDAFFEMKTSIDNNQKVMFILPDGLSFEQVEYYKDDLTFFKENYIRAATVNPAISNVSLASLITGVSPFETGIYERCIKKPDAQDIFDYALSKGKKVSYIEGNGNLLITNINQIYSMPDENGLTDKSVFENAQSELAKNPDLIFIHFHGIDDVNHNFSPISNESKNKILETEEYIKQLAQNFDGKIIVVPDHGHIGYTDSNGDAKGYHGLFENGDMYVPYYVINQN